MRTRDYKAELDEIANGYQEARDEEFNAQFRDMFFMATDILTEDDIQGFLDSFTFPDEEDWAADEFESRRDSYYDAKMEEEKDRRMGIE